MVREKVKAKKARLDQDQSSFSLEEESGNDELMELYEEQTIKNMENIKSLETMLEAEDISDASAQIEEYSQRYDQDEEMVQCVPELLVTTPVESVNKPKTMVARHRPRIKSTPKRKSPGKAARKNIKASSNFPSVATQNPDVASESEDEFPKAKKEGTWIQCAKTDCLKWRKLPNDIEPSTLPHRWVCAMNPDSTRTACTASQETCDSQEDFDVVYTTFVPGSLVWAKVPGYPWWPGMVEDDPDYNCYYETDESNVNPISYHVSFIFDKEVSRSWVSYLGIRNFDGTENPNEIGPKQKKQTKSLARALVQARNAMDLTLAQRIQKFSFNILYKGQIGSETDEKRRKIKKRRQSKTSPDAKKTNALKLEKKTKRPSLTESEKSSDTSQSVIAKKKVKRRKNVLASSDEESSGKDTTSHALTINSDTSQHLAENLQDEEELEARIEEVKHSSEVQLEEKVESFETKDQVSSQNSEIDYLSSQGEKQSGKSKDKRKKKNKPGKTKSEAFKKKRKSMTSDEESPAKTKSPNQLKVKKKKLTKSKDSTCKNDGKRLKKKSKFIKPAKLKSADVLNASDVSANSLRERMLAKLSLDTSTDSSSMDVSVDTSSMDDFSTSTEDISPTRKPHSSPEELKKLPVEETANDSKESEVDNKKTPAFKPKKKKSSKVSTDKSDTKDLTKVSVVKPKKFELTLPINKKNKPTDENRAGKVKKTNFSKKSGREKAEASRQACASTSEIVLDGSSVKSIKATHDDEKMKTSKIKKMKQTFGKFKAPVKTKSTVTPACSNTNKDEEKVVKTLEKVLVIPSSDDPRKNPEKYVSIDSLENDISNLYQELSESAAASVGARNDEDLDEVTEASDCVTVEFLDQQISGNTGNSEKITRRRLTDSPEF